MGILRFVLFALVLSAMAVAQQAPSSAQAVKKGETRPEPIPGFSMAAMDKSVDPCVDFYHYACGGWMKSNPIPPDQARWGRFNELAERNRDILRDILEKASVNDPKRDADRQKIGDYYASCMDEKAVNAKGTAVLQPYLERINALKSSADLPELLADLQKEGVSAFFATDSTQDFKDANMVIAEVDQGGLGLPDRDYYLKPDPKSVETRSQYQAHVQKMFELMGDRADTAAAEAKTVMEVETRLAKVSMDRTSRREPANVYHKMSVQQLEELSPKFSWPKFFVATGAPKFTELNVTTPEFFKEFSAVASTVPIADLKTYLRWHVVNATADLLPDAFVEENFAFYGKTLTGAKEIRPRWKRCVSHTDHILGEALGQPYVEQTFGVEGKQRTLKMVHALEQALKEDIEGLPWMTEDTKKQALVKLAAITNKIGYPDKWRDYSKLNIVRGDLLGDTLRGNAFEYNRQLDKIGKPPDRKEWFMSPPTVNAYYDPQMNNINFPAGILQPPFYDNNMDDAVNFGGIGAVIGHELTHGFDDQGRKFDAQGNLRDWWTKTDEENFVKHADCLVNEYSSFNTVDDVKLNGKLTLGENTADNGGLRVALMALLDTIKGKQVAPIDGFTPEQRVFLGYGQIWCSNRTDQIARMLATVDPHSPPEWRVLGVVQNMPEFSKAFGCKQGQPMVRAQACRVW
jgi:endothelin-converting enzyme/putative endopeptidase